MTDNLKLRLQFLVRVIEKEQRYLQLTAQRLFSRQVDVKLMQQLEQDTSLSEQLDAFASRYGRFQDNVGDKLLPATLMALGEKTGPVLDNLNRAEKFGWLQSTDDWLTARQLRNKMVHEYIEDPAILAEALNSAYQFIPLLDHFANALINALKSRNQL